MPVFWIGFNVVMFPASGLDAEVKAVLPWAPQAAWLLSAALLLSPSGGVDDAAQRRTCS